MTSRLAFLSLVLLACSGSASDDLSTPNTPDAPDKTNAPGNEGTGASTGPGASYQVDPASLRARTSTDLAWVGGAVDATMLADDAYATIAGRELNSITPENAMKWGEVDAVRGKPDWAAADAIVAFAKAHAQAVHGHTLVWHQQMPNWLDALSADELRTALDAHIREEVGRYAGKVRSWDVVNEAIDDDPVGSPRLTVFSKLGETWIADAFHSARAADANAKLYYNDYGIEGAGPKADAAFALVSKAKQAGVPIDGVGFEMHVEAYDFSSFGLREDAIRKNIQRYAALGLNVRFSEVDIRIANSLGTDIEKAAYQAVVAGKLVELCRTEPGCDAVTFWGIGDATSWIQKTYGPDAPLLWDTALAPKPAYAAVKTALSASPEGSLDRGGTHCGSTLSGSAWCAPYEALDSGRDAVVTSNGVLDFAAPNPFLGRQSMRAKVNASGAQALALRNVFPKLAAGSVHLRGYVRLASNPPPKTVTLAGLQEAAAPYRGVSVVVADDGKLGLSLADGSYVATTTTFTKDAWQCLSLAVGIDGSQGTVSLSVGGTKIASLTGKKTRPADGISTTAVGILYATGAAEAAFDEFAAGTSPLPCD